MKPIALRLAPFALALTLALDLGSSTLAAALSLEVMAGQSYYTQERTGHLILLVHADTLARLGAVAQVLRGDEVLVAGVYPDVGRRVTVPVPLTRLPQGDSEVTCRLVAGGVEIARAATRVSRLPPKANAVKIDRLGGGLIVDDLPFFPMGFYCYSPVQAGLAEAEVVGGFNFISPYQTNLPEALGERQAYMDRCAALGMKVHYQLLSVAGGGGVGGATADETGAREAQLRAEVEAFRDHPALLAWYISDEPTGHNTLPETLERSYDIVRDLDPYHPISVVFMAPDRAGEYAGAMDLVMTDPYPIPNGPPAAVSGAVRSVAEVFEPAKPVWLVPQTFGGNEWWSREPTAAEQRVMTWLGIVDGATGIQYFIRHGLSRFPKSPVLWGACTQNALEVAAVTPFLLSHEARPGVLSSSSAVRAAAWRYRGHVLIAAVNTENIPVEVELTVEGAAADTGAAVAGELPLAQADVLFGDRSVPVRSLAARPTGLMSLLTGPADLLSRAILGGPGKGDHPRMVLEDALEPYGVRLYRLVESDREWGAPVPVSHRNLILDPGFEWEPAPATPAAVYAGRGGARGAQSFLDGRVALEGRHSLRLHTPSLEGGVPIAPYSPTVGEGRTYRLSVWARASADSQTRTRVAMASMDSLLADADSTRTEALKALRQVGGPALYLAVGPSRTWVPLTTDWQEHHLDAAMPEGASRAAITLSLATPGTAWLDMLQLYDISPSIAPEAQPDGGFTVAIDNFLDDAELHYTLDGSPPAVASPLYTRPFPVERTTRVRCAVFRAGRAVASSEATLHRHDAAGRFADLQTPPSPRYPAGGPGALTDGLLGGSQFRDGLWQGFEGADVVAVIDLGREMEVRAVSTRFLQNSSSWIWMPRQVSVYVSADGNRYERVALLANEVADNAAGTLVRDFAATDLNATGRFVRVHAESIGQCPSWHAGAGGPAWLFLDEIRVNGD